MILCTSDVAAKKDSILTAVLATCALFAVSCRVDRLAVPFGEEPVTTNTLVAAASLPAGVRMELASNTPPGETVYQFFHDDMQILGVHAGDAPAFPLRLTNAACELVVLDGVRCAIARDLNDDLYSKEILIDLTERKTYPRYIHAGYADMTFSNMVAAERMLGVVFSNVVYAKPQEMTE